MKNLPASLHKKTISMHPLAMVGVMCVFAYPALAISHVTDNLATHKHIRDLALGFSAAFFAFFTIVLLLQLAAELEKIKVAKNYSIPGLLFGFITFALGFCVAVGGAIASSIIIKVLDSNVPAQAKVISQQTAAINYALVAGALFMLIGYAITRASVKNKRTAPLFSAASMSKTSSLWFLFIMGLGTAGAFTLKSAPQISNTEIVVYSSMLFFAAVVIGMPKIIHALNKHNKISGQEGQSVAMSGKLYWSLFLPLVAFGMFGSGITAAIYGDPLYGSILVVVGMLPLALAGALSDSSSPKVSQLGFNAVNSPQHNKYKVMDDEVDDYEQESSVKLTSQ